VPEKGDYSFRARLNSFRYAFSGLFSFFRNEPNAAIHLVAAVLAVSLGFILNIDPVRWVILTILIVFVFVTEIINSAIEKLADIINPAISPEIKKIKDYAAAAVLISALAAIIGGLLIFLPEL
jgi:diacylglycerol kinase